MKLAICVVVVLIAWFLNGAFWYDEGGRDALRLPADTTNMRWSLCCAALAAAAVVGAWW